MTSYRNPTIASSPSARGGCCFLIVLLGALLAARIAYVQVTDRRAIAAATRRCTAEGALQVRQPHVWHDYLRQLPPTEPFSTYVSEMRRVQQAMGLQVSSFSSGDDHGFVLVNAKGEVARVRYVSAVSVAFSIEGVRTSLYSCFEHHPAYYKDAAAI